MALKKVKLPDNTYIDIADARLVSDGIVYIGVELDDAEYQDGGTVVNLADYAKRAWVIAQGYLTQHQPLKTINNQSLIGTGNITITGGGGGGGGGLVGVTFNGVAATVVDNVAAIVATVGDVNTIETVKVNSTALTPDANKAVNIVSTSVLFRDW